jgi:CheY-like chemotaxis protein
MIRALLCGAESFEADLQGSLLSREGVEIHKAQTLEEAREIAATVNLHLILVDQDLPGVERIVVGLRRELPTRACSIVAVARGDFDPKDAEVLEVGANAVLRLPVAPEWDVRLTRLVSVPGRRDVRIAVGFKVRGLWGEVPIPALALNLSLHGMLAEAQTELQVGDEIGLSFEVPTSPVAISGTGRVVRKAGPTRVGLEFVELDGESPQELGAFLAAEGGL